jgi:hypothetical protein
MMGKVLAASAGLLGILAAALAVLAPGAAWAWGASGHSIVAEIAERRLNDHAAQQVALILGRGHSLASVSSWADDVRPSRPQTANWHFVDIPIAQSAYNAATECAQTQNGDCVLGELDRLRGELRCSANPSERNEALRFAVHFVADLHQPLHTVAEARGGNEIAVSVDIHGLTCARGCAVSQSNLHSVWDTGLIEKSVYDWGAYVDRLENGWLTSDEAKAAARSRATPLDWALDTHAQAQRIWALTPANGVLDDAYFAAAQPILDRQLSLGGIHLAQYLNDAFDHGC